MSVSYKSTVEQSHQLICGYQYNMVLESRYHNISLQHNS